MKTEVSKITMTFAVNYCGWRAVYLSRALSDGCESAHQFFHVGIDPNNGTRPQMFGAIASPFKRRGPGSFHLKFRFGLPHVPWRYYDALGPVSRVAYRISSRFWHRMDGRYGLRRKIAA